MKKIELFTDGSCLGNPGPGGYGAFLRFGPHHKKIAAGFKLTTNNRMEMLAAIEGLNQLTERCHVSLTTDSQYLRQGITKWVHGWKKRNWITANQTPVKNVDLWQQLDKLVQQHHVEWHWVKGHAGHKENELCDNLAKEAAQGTKLATDTGYEQAQHSISGL